MFVYIKENRVPLDQEVIELKVAVSSLNKTYSRALEMHRKIVEKFGLKECLENLNDCTNAKDVKKMGFPIRTLGYAVKDLSDALKELEVHKVYGSRDDINELLGLLSKKTKTKPIIIGS
jgi:ATP-dependent Clp protease ATP-binding subunit ClpA